MAVRIGVSACLLGERVRWNGGHEEAPLLTKTLAPFVQWVPVCPEVEAGLGVPRPTVRLHQGDGLRLVESEDGSRDHTGAMQRASAAWLAAAPELDGFVLKKGSPSCGPDRVRVYRDGLPPRTDGQGLFAAALQGARPLLPWIDDGRLNDPGLREAFFDQVFAHARLRALGDRPTAKQLMEFHGLVKYTLLSHDPEQARLLGRWLASAPKDAARRRAEYGERFLAALAKPPTRRKHANVLQHIQGFLRGRLDAGDTAELTAVIEQYRTGLVPLVVPVTLLRHHLRRTDAPDWVRQQTYLEPFPQELMLRNHG